MARGMDRLAVVTGASRGIGRALSEALTQRGWRVLAASREGRDVGAATGIACDLAMQEGREALLEAVRAEERPLDLLVNNAGIQQALDFSRPDPELTGLTETEIAVNLVAPLVLTAGLVPLMRQPGGTIVNVTSIIALQPKPSAPVYSASKAGLAAFTKAMRRQLAPLGIRVVEAMPPLVATDMTAGRDAGALSADDMAAAILDGLDSGRDIVAPGKAALVRRLNRVFPGLVAAKMGAM